MIQDLFALLKGLSKLHVIPLYKWDKLSLEVLDELLQGMLYFITPQGNVFIGEKSIEDMKENKLCLQAHLDHPGGYLQYDTEGEYFYSNYQGNGKTSLTGHKMGLFVTGEEASIGEMEVEHTVWDHLRGVSIFFKEKNSEIEERLSKQRIAVHMNAVPQNTGYTIENWSLDNLLHAAVLIYLLKYCNPAGAHYGLLTLNEEMNQSGIYEFMNLTKKKELFYINMDVTGEHNKGIPSFGVRKTQKGQILDQYLPSALKDWLETEQKLVELKKGGTETNTILGNGIKATSVYIQIENYHNRLPKQKHLPESVDIRILEEYMMFLIEFLQKFEDLSTEFSNLVLTKTEKDASVLDCYKVRIEDYTKEIQAIFIERKHYHEYLHSGMQKIRAIYEKYQLPLPYITSDNYKNVRELVLSTEPLNIDCRMVAELAEKITDELDKVFHAEKSFLRKEIPDISILVVVLTGFNASNIYTPEKTIAFSADKLHQEDLPRVIIHELTHYLSRVFWRALNINPRLLQYYDEGLAVNMVGKLLDYPVGKALNMNQEEMEMNLANISMLKKQFDYYKKGNLCSVYRGKYHTYFSHREIKNPFRIQLEVFDRYGYFLAATELNELNRGGILDAEVFCK